MNPTLRNLTKYFRDAVVSQTTQQVEVTEESVKTTYASILDGKLDPAICAHLFKPLVTKESTAAELDADIEEEKQTQTVKIIVALQVVNIKSEGGVKHNADIGDLTGAFFLPALLEETGRLSPDSERIPWIPRKYLAPIVDDALIVGEVHQADLFIGSKTKELFDIRETGRWDLYIAFAKAFWAAVNKTELDGEFIYSYTRGKQPVFLDEFAYLIPDQTVLATRHIKKLYEYALQEDQGYSPLYQTLLSMTPKAESNPVANELPQIFKHSGQMNGSYPLSPSQREAINHFSVLEHGDVLAVNGPPGTGKTTLLQTIVADTLVKHALAQKDAPIIVATSTNNQAVTNIIESFAATSNGKHPKELDCHWIAKKESFATYFPSKQKITASLQKGYQVSSFQMGDSVAEWEAEENIERSRTSVMEKCRALFGDSTHNLKQCIQHLHQLLEQFDHARKKMLELSKTLPATLQIPAGEAAKGLEAVNGEIAACIAREEGYKRRLDAWKKLWRSLIFYRIFQFIPVIKKRLHLKLHNFLNIDEVAFADTLLRFSDVEAYYHTLLHENRVRFKGYQTAKEILEIAATLDPYAITVFASSSATVSLETDALNALFDTNIRFFEFWISVHYYECRWLSGEHKTKEEDLFKSTFPVMQDKYRRLCMLTPCLVMTFYMLPANFTLYKDKYLYDFIDLLIVDEAGQVSPEIGAGAFLLAKKALVVGDIFQIEPVWSVPRELDIALAVDRGVIGPNEFSVLEENGLNTSESSLMKVACHACAFSKHGRKGLLLTEHRRCYDELIGYCNELVYDGKLEPMRGSAEDDKRYPFPGEPTILHIQVSTERSEIRKTSRYNLSESAAIKQWIAKHYQTIRTKYPNEGEDRLIGVITPFKAQAEYIRQELQDLGAIAKNITVGTVHTFQGGERRIVLFSTVYGAKDGCAFLDYKKNLMNVAMSRAKDRFLVFGDINCLSTSKETPSGLLRKYLK